MTSAASRDLFMPRAPGGLGSGLVLALLVHGLLVAALAFGVSWRSSNPQGIQAELWAAVPQVAAPRAATTEEAPPPARPAPEPPPPPPPPRPAPPVERSAPPPPRLPDPKIAIEQEKREAARKQALAEAAERKAEAERTEKKRQELQAERDKAREVAAERARQQSEQAAQAKAKAQAEQAAQAKAKAEQSAKAAAEAKRLADAREDAIRRITAQAGGNTGEPGSTGTADRTAAPSDGYTGRVIARIKPNIVFIDTLASNPEAEVLVRLAPDGRIISQKLVRSSGSPEWDQAVQRAIARTEILPRDIDGRVPSSMSITFRPRE
jgi:colicin import membrane protein